MIDEVIKSHIDALNANTEALNRLISLLSNSPALAPAPVPPVTPAAPATVVNNATVAPAPVVQLVPASTPAPAPAPAPVANNATTAPAPTQPAMTLEELRNICVTAGAKGFTGAVVEFLTGQGVKKINDLNPAMYPALIDFLKSKGAI